MSDNLDDSDSRPVFQPKRSIWARMASPIAKLTGGSTEEIRQKKFLKEQQMEHLRRMKA